MPTPIPQTPPDHLSIADQITQKINAVVASATAEDRAVIAAWKDKAMSVGDNPACEFVVITPVLAALLFVEENDFNRPWHPDWTAIYAQIMAEGDWRAPGPQGYALYRQDGKLGDGAHRMGAQAYSGTTLTMLMYFGTSKEDVATLDCGHNRTAADVAYLAGIANAKAKEAVLGNILSYEKRAGEPVPTLLTRRNNKRFSEEIVRQDALLSRALEIGEASIVDVPDELVQANTAAAIAGLLMRHGWPEDRIGERLDEVQTADFDQEGNPLWKARGYIETHRKPADVPTSAQEESLVVKAMVMAEAGLNTSNPRREKDLMAALKKPVVPTYPKNGGVPGPLGLPSPGFGDDD